MNFEELVVKTSHIANRNPSRLTRSALDPVTQETIHRVLVAAIQAIRLELQAGGYVRINSVGTLSTFLRKAYERPINLPSFGGQRVTISAKRVVRFKASADLVTLINQPPDEKQKPNTWKPPEREIKIGILVVTCRANNKKQLPND